MATGPLQMSETQMAFRLGVDRDWMKAHRGPKGVLWDIGPHGQITYTPAAYDALVALLEPKTAGPAEPSPEALPVAENAPAPAGEPVLVEAAAKSPGPAEAETLEVVWCRFPNQRVLQAKTAGGDLVTVWVLQARRFAPRMRILAFPRPGRPNVYDFAGNPENPLAGNRMPRRPGVW